MSTLQQTNSNTARLRFDLAAIESDLTQARSQFTALTGGNGDPKQAEALAARVMVLDARRAATLAAIEKSETEAARVGAIFESKEYKDAIKRLDALDQLFSKEAAAIRAELSALRDRLAKARVAHAEYCDLIGRYCLDQDAIQQMTRIQNPDYYYLAAVKNWLDRQAKEAEYKQAQAGPSRPDPAKEPKPQPQAAKFWTPGG